MADQPDTRPDAGASPAGPAPLPAELAGRLEKLRAAGVDRNKPLTLARIDALARRAATQPATVRDILFARIAALLDSAAQPPADAERQTVATAGPGPLAELLAHIAGHDAGVAPRPAPGNAASAPGRPRAPARELKSVAYFRQTWSRLSTEQQLTQTLAQAPANAGPMNSQHLVLRALETMRDISPDYLQAFMSYVDTLIWLEHADPSRPPNLRSTGDNDKKRRRTTARPDKTGKSH